ncbi:MAG TPA: HD domain-containing protein [Gemmatimonadaceae bacterium]|nr:HD domain-containing protein [Gemmatimonadaceae bacterium]
MPPLDFPRLQTGDRINHELRVVERRELRKRDNEPYIVLTLGNATGQIDTGPIWLDKLDSGWADGAVRGAVVQAIGHVSVYDGRGTSKRQLELTAPLRALPRDGLRLDDYLPAIDGSTTRLWDRVDRFRAELDSPTLRRVVDLFFADDAFRVRFERAPASIGGHHARVGGLLLHVYEVAYIGRETARVMRANADLVVAGALLHDIGKTETYDASWEGFVRTPCGHLVEHVVMGCLMLERAIAALGEPVCSEGQLLELQHLILSHHGEPEFGSPVRPLTPEAEILHWADQASAKSSDVIEGLADEEAFRDGGEFGDRQRLWRVKRSLWRRSHDWS